VQLRAGHTAAEKSSLKPTEKAMKIILGSSSQWRRSLISKLGYDKVEFVSAGIDEKAIHLPDPYALTLALAAAKAEALVKKLGRQDALLITADMVMTWRGKILGKPADADEARFQLRLYGQGHNAPMAVAAVRVTRLDAPALWAEGVAKADLDYQPLPDEVIEQAVRQPETYTMAGSHNVMNPLVRPYIKLFPYASSDTVLGLPVKLTQKLIVQAFAL
jgi:septum formation protein